MGAFDKKKEILVPDDEGGPASEAYRKKHGPNATAAQEFRDKWGWEPHEQIMLRGRMTAGIQEDTANASTAISADNKPMVTAGTGRNVMLERMIVRWTLMRNGHPVDVTLDAIRELPFEYSTPLLEICDKLMAANMSAEEQKRFLVSAKGRTKESSDEEK